MVISYNVLLFVNNMSEEKTEVKKEVKKDKDGNVIEEETEVETKEE